MFRRALYRAKHTAFWFTTTEMLLQYARHHTDNSTTCSCYMCGNPRKYFKEKTRQEEIFDLSSTEQIEDIDDDCRHNIK